MGHTSKVVWKNDLLFDGTVDNKINVPLHLGNTEDTISPMGIMLSALVGCTAMDVISILQKKRQEVTAFEVETAGEQATDNPHVYKNVRIVYRVKGVNIDEAAVARAIELSITKYCGAYATISKTAEMETTYEIINES